MTPEGVRTLFDYDAWANNRTLDSCSTLSPEQFTRNLGSSFRSVRDTLVHITGSQWIWLERFRGRSHSAPPAPMDAFADLAAVRESADRIQGELSAHVAALTAADLARNLEYRNTQGTSFQTPDLASLAASGQSWHLSSRTSDDSAAPVGRETGLH